MRRFSLRAVSAALQKSRSGRRVVLTGGTFDLPHVGHLQYLEWCKALGDMLVVCVAGDQRVRRRKGIERPILPEAARARLISGLKPVDFTFISNAPPFARHILNALQPNVIATSRSEPSRASKSRLARYVRKEYPSIEVRFYERSKRRPAYASTSGIIQTIRATFSGDRLGGFLGLHRVSSSKLPQTSRKGDQRQGVD